jgi:hypothetical protein
MSVSHKPSAALIMLFTVQLESKIKYIALFAKLFVALWISQIFTGQNVDTSSNTVQRQGSHW